MSILIRGREMPENCQECVCLNDEYFYCQAVGRKPQDENVISRRPDWCPIVYVPPHGRLIDADKLHKATYHRAFETDGDTMWQSGCWVRYRAIEQVQDSQPTIIEAEE